jgi:hypothetical protein
MTPSPARLVEQLKAAVVAGGALPSHAAIDAWAQLAVGRLETFRRGLLLFV